jgi:hypothetical protein
MRPGKGNCTRRLNQLSFPTAMLTSAIVQNQVLVQPITLGNPLHPNPKNCNEVSPLWLLQMLLSVGAGPSLRERKLH